MRTRLVVVLVLAGCHQKPPRVDLGAAAHPMGAIKDVRIGMSLDEVRKVAPALEFEGDHASLSNAETDEHHTVRFTQGRVSMLTTQFFHREPDDLWKAWGSHGLDLGHDKFRFVDAAAKLRAEVSPQLPHGFAISFEDFQPLDAVLAGPDTNALAGIAVLGRPLAEVLADFRKTGSTIDETMPESPEIRLPPTEFSGGPFELNLEVKAGVVTGWALLGVAFQPTPEMKQQLLEHYSKRWGAPTVVGHRNTYNKEPWIYVEGADTNEQIVRGQLDGVAHGEYPKASSAALQ